MFRTRRTLLAWCPPAAPPQTAPLRGVAPPAVAEREQLVVEHEEVQPQPAEARDGVGDARHDRLAAAVERRVDERAAGAVAPLAQQDGEQIAAVGVELL